MAEYIEKKKLVNRLKMWLMDLENDMDKGDYGELCENKGAREAVESCICEVEEQPLADVQPINRWISVKDRLPETGESVLVYIAINKNLKGFGECEPEIRIGWLDDDGKWALQFSNMNYSEVLCWMPLPEPPKDGDTE